MRILLCLFVISLFFSSAAAAAPAVKEGTLDLSAYSLSDSGPVDLRGGWHFYWLAFPGAGEFDQAAHSFIQAPATWGSQPIGIRNHGYGTYRLKILLAEETAGRTLGLYIPSVASAYELRINGAKLASRGKIGISAGDMTPKALPQTLYFTPNGQVLELTLYVSNFVQRKGGMWDNLRLGTAERMAKERESSLLFQMFIAAGLLIIGIYHVGLYLFRPDRSALYFGLASLSLFLRAVFVRDLIAVLMIPSLPWELSVKIEYLSVFFGFSFLVLYFYHLYENNLRRTTSHGLAIAMIGVSLPVLILPAKVYTEWLVYYELALLVLVAYILYGLARAVFRRRAGSVMNLAAGLIFLATVVNDIVYYTFHFETIDLVMFGLFTFIFTQMFMLSRKFAAAFLEAENLKNELQDVNENLEAVVAERTAALRKSNEQLENSERSRKELMSHIIHELGNPLTSIIGYLRRVKNGAPEETAARHVRIAYQKALTLEHVTDDLRQLVKLEHGRLAFELRTVDLARFYNELQGIYDWDLLDRKVVFQWKLPRKGKFVVNADLHRIGQAFTNLVDNALAHTKPGDRITITGRCLAYAQACAVTVEDTGTGVPKADQAHLFDRFYRVKRPEGEQREGTGLGLAIARAIVEEHRGRIGVRSEYGKGSSFYFILPVEPGSNFVKEDGHEVGLHSDC